MVHQFVVIPFIELGVVYHAPIHQEYPKDHGHKGDPGVTPETCCAIGKRPQVILVWMRAPGIGNTSHP